MPPCVPQIQEYLHLLEDSNGHYLFRWGDAPIHTFVVGMFLEPSQVHQFNFAYRHKGWYDRQRRGSWLLPWKTSDAP